jgi:hypothetical protein
MSEQRAKLELIKVREDRQFNDGFQISAGTYRVQELEDVIYLHFADERSGQAEAGGFYRLTRSEYDQLMQSGIAETVHESSSHVAEAIRGHGKFGSER